VFIIVFTKKIITNVYDRLIYNIMYRYIILNVLRRWRRAVHYYTSYCNYFSLKTRDDNNNNIMYLLFPKTVANIPKTNNRLCYHNNIEPYIFLLFCVFKTSALSVLVLECVCVCVCVHELIALDNTVMWTTDILPSQHCSRRPPALSRALLLSAIVIRKS